MRRGRLGLAAVVGIVAAAASAAYAQETTTYVYDELGRLVSSSISGGPNNSRVTGTCFDRAGNRIRYDVATTQPATCPTPAPTPTPGP